MEMHNEARKGSRGNRQELGRVLSQFEGWRAEKQRGEKIPPQLWQAAASLYPRYSVNRIARALRLGSMDLRDRVRPDRKNRRPKRQEAAQFVPLSVAPAGGLADCRLMVKDGRKARLTIRLKGAAVGSLVEVLREVWSRGT